MEFILVFLLLIGVMLIGRWLNRPMRVPQGQYSIRPSRPPRPKPQPPPRPRWRRVLKCLFKYSRSFAYHCLTGIILGLGVYYGIQDPVMSRFYQTALISICLLVSMLAAMRKFPVAGSLMKASSNQIPKKFKNKVINFCWTNGLAALIVMGYMASRNSPSLF